MERIGRWNVRLVREGDHYGLNDCLTHDGEPMVEFYDAHQDPEKFGPRGQFVSRYFVETFLEDRAKYPGCSLALNFGIPAWTASAHELAQVKGWICRSMRSMTNAAEVGRTHNKCVYPECTNTRRTRGLCHGHYQTMRDRVRRGLADEADLLERGLLMPKGTGGSPINGADAFLKGSDVRGDA